MQNTGFIPAASGSMRIRANTSANVKLQLTAKNLQPLTDYMFLVNGITYKAASNSTHQACAVSWEVGSGNLLDPNEKVRVTVDLAALTQSGTGSVPNAGLVLQNEQFKTIVKPPYGSVLDIVRNAPAQITTVNDLN